MPIQISISNAIKGQVMASGGNLLLDLYPNAALAYSLRRLSSSFSGSPIRVRRSSDNAEQDIPFDGSGDLDTANLLAFVGSNDGFICDWYDQSGNSNNAFANSAANQAKIVSSGVVETDNTNGKPTSVWASDKYDLTNNVLTTIEYYNIVKIRRPNRNTNTIITIAANTTSPRILTWSPNGSGNTYVSNMDGQVTFGSSVLQSGYILDTYRQADGEMFLFRNNAQQGGTPNTTNVGSTLNRFGSRGAQFTTGEYQECILWNDNTYNDRAAIYDDLDTYYQ